MRTPATVDRRAAARSQLIKLLAERLVRQALSEKPPAKTAPQLEGPKG